MSSATTDASRPSTAGDNPAVQQGPIPLFDYHLRVLTDSYLTFFLERRKIEEAYVDALNKLYRKGKAIDAILDDRGDLNTTRSAWNEVRDHVDREAQTRHAFLDTLTKDVVTPLIALKESQDRTRKRIKEDLKDSSLAYNEYADGILPKLKRTYMKKCQDVEDHKAAAASPTTQQPPLPTSPIQDLQHNPLTNSRSNPNLPSKPEVTSPRPLRALDRRPSGSMPGKRDRSPSSSTAFSDLAHQGLCKKQINQLIGFLDKGGVKDSLGIRSDNNSSLRAVRAKREADEADKEYRKGVHWLETLRLRRTKTLEGGYKSLEMFVRDASATVKKVLEKYTDNMIATATTHTQLSTYARTAVSHISPDKDASILASQIPRSLASAIPKPILYRNHHVGECADLIFGVSLVDYATARGLGGSSGEAGKDGKGDVTPKIVRICVHEVNQRGLASEGIYRVSGRHAIVQELQHKIECNERAFEFNPLTDDVFAVASLLKLYLRELPEPVFRYPLQDRVQHTEDREEHKSNNFMLLRAKMRRLPAVHLATLRAIVEHLARVVSHSEKNKMDAKNLAIVFGGAVFGEDDLPKGGDLLNVQNWKDTLMEDLIMNAAILFDDRTSNNTPITPNSPPLPPAPAGEPVPDIAYGSSHTKVSTVPPPPPSPTNDFAPPLPPRPTNSIHPSLRTGLSPTKERMQTLLPKPEYITEEAEPAKEEKILEATPSVETGPPPTSPKSIDNPELVTGSLPDPKAGEIIQADA